MAQIIPGGVVGPTQGQYEQQSAQNFSQGAANMFTNARDYRAGQRQQRFANAQTMLQRHLESGRTLGEFYEDYQDVVGGMLKDGLGYRGKALDEAVERFRTGEMSSREQAELGLRDITSGGAAPTPAPQPRQGQDPWRASSQQVGYTPPGGQQPPPPPPQGPQTGYAPGDQVAPVTNLGPQANQGQQGPPPASMQGIPTEHVDPNSPVAQQMREQATGMVDPRSLGNPNAAYAAAGRAEQGLPTNAEQDAMAGRYAALGEAAARGEPVSVQERLSVPEIAESALTAIAENPTEGASYAQFNETMPPVMSRTEDGAIIEGKQRDGVTPERLQQAREVALEFGYVDENGEPDLETYEAMRQLAIDRAQRGETDLTALPTPSELASPYMSTVREEIKNDPAYIQRNQENLEEAVTATTSPDYVSRVGDYLESAGAAPGVGSMLASQLSEEAETLGRSATEAATVRSAGGQPSPQTRREINQTTEELLDTIDRTRTVADYREMRSTPEGQARLNELYISRMNDPSYVQLWGMVHNQPQSIAQSAVMKQIEAAQTPEAMEQNLIELALEARKIAVQEHEAVSDRMRAEATQYEANTGRLLANLAFDELEQKGVLESYKLMMNENVYDSLDDSARTRLQETVLTEAGFDPDDMTVQERGWIFGLLQDKLLVGDTASRGFPGSRDVRANAETATRATNEGDAYADALLGR